MTFLRLLNIQGIAGIAVALALGLMLLVQKGETRHWRKQSGQFEQLYRAEQSAFARTVANYRAAAETARAADRAAADRVRAEQQAINERIAHDYQARLADARARARRLQLPTAAATADSCRGGAAPVPGLPAAACGAAEAAGEDRLPAGDALVATEQAIQLDALIGWVKRQSRIDPNAPR
ncbi:MAG TPA: hypothetical protein VF079_08380 [Sphingomicrobium sp.]